jgi:hypothetical protein
MAMELIRRLYSWGVDWELFKDHPARDLIRLKEKLRDTVWSEDVEARFLDAADEPIKHAYYLLLYSAQRQADGLKFTWQKYNDGRLFFGKARAEGSWTYLPLPISNICWIHCRGYQLMFSSTKMESHGRPEPFKDVGVRWH